MKRKTKEELQKGLKSVENIEIKPEYQLPDGDMVVQEYDGRMKTKLIKTGDQYLLQDEAGETLAITNGTIKGRMLSLKNCQAIENGYDLDELAKETTRNFLGPDVPENIMVFITHSKMFQKGFKKALSILDGKNFSINEMEYARDKGKRDGDILWNEFIQLLQQTEWDVEIETEVIPDLDSRPEIDGQIFSTNKKEVIKLDMNGCLILKRI